MSWPSRIGWGHWISLGFAAPVLVDDLPKPTEEGIEALSRLIDGGVAGGRLKVVRPLSGDKPTDEVVDGK